MIRDFANHMLLQPHGAVQMVDRMATTGLVVRGPSSTDGRGVTVSLTTKGALVLADLAEQHVGALLAQEPLLAESLSRLWEMGEKMNQR